MRERLRQVLHRVVTRVRTGGRASVLWSMRITVAAVASYVVATLLFPGTQPLLAPLTAMLVVQVTPVSLLATGLDRVVAVAAGVSLAAAVSAVVPLEWWSLGLLIFVCLTIGQALRLRANLIEVAISGMLVLGVGALAAESAAWERIAQTLVGAAVGIAANLLFPPKVATADAGQAIDGLADSVKDLLDLAAGELTELAESAGDPTPAARAWLGEARSISHDIPRIGAALIHAEEGRRLNVRAVGTPNVAPGLRQGLEALEHCTIAIRGMFRAIVDAPWTLHTEEEDEDSREVVRDVLLDLANTFREMSAGVDAFGQLVRDEADPGKRMSAADVDGLREALEGLHEARARLEERLTAGGMTELLELHAAVLTTVKRLQREMDLDERVRRQVRLQRPTRPRRPPRATAGLPPAPAEPSPDDETQVLPAQPQDRWTRRQR